MACLFSQYIPEFLIHLNQDAKAALTISAYKQDLEQLEKILENQPKTTDILSREQIQFALIKLSSQNQHPKSLARYLSTWRQFCVFLTQKGVLTHNPCLGIKAPKSPKHLPKSMSIEKTGALLDGVASADILIVRDRAIFELMYSSGLRLSEITGLNLDDVDFELKIVRVLGKGQKERVIPVGDTALNALKQYFDVRVASVEEPAIFTSRNGNRLSNRQVQNRLNRWTLLAESDRHVTPHMFRHSFASHMLQESKDIRLVQEMLGHRDLSTTQIYTSLDFRHLAETYDQAHPRAKRKK